MGAYRQLVCAQAVDFTVQTPYSDISTPSKALQDNVKISLKEVEERKQGWLVAGEGERKTSKPAMTFQLPSSWLLICETAGTSHMIGLCYHGALDPNA